MKRAFAFGLGLMIVIALPVLTGCNGGARSDSNTSPPSSSPTPAAVSSSAQVVKVNPLPVEISQAGTADATVKLLISPGFHVNANPATFPYLIATELTTGKTEGITVSMPAYPTPEKKKFQFAEQPLAVYEGEVSIKFNLRAEKSAAAGPRSLPITVRVQACDEKECFPPATLDATISVTVK